MKSRYLVPGLLTLALFATPALAQGFNDRDGPTITGTQMTDWPSGRANMTLSGSFLRPNFGGPHSYNARHRHFHRYHRRYRHRDYDDRY